MRRSELDGSRTRIGNDLTKVELAEKYEWEEWHGDECQCVYCVFAEMLARRHEARRG